MDSLFQKACSAHPSYTSYTDNAYTYSGHSSYSSLTDTNSSCQGGSAQQKNQCPTKDAFGREAYLPLGQYLSSPSCWAPLPTEGETEGVSSSSSSSVPPISTSYGSLQYSPYDCAALPTCEVNILLYIIIYYYILLCTMMYYDVLLYTIIYIYFHAIT
jgi:hypothetical protein